MTSCHFMHKLQWDFYPNIEIFVRENAIETVFCKVCVFLPTAMKAGMVGSLNSIPQQLYPHSHGAVKLLIGLLGTNFNEIISHTFSFMKIHFKMLSRPQCVKSLCPSDAIWDTLDIIDSVWLATCQAPLSIVLSITNFSKCFIQV